MLRCVCTVPQLDRSSPDSRTITITIHCDMGSASSISSSGRAPSLPACQIVSGRYRNSPLPSRRWAVWVWRSGGAAGFGDCCAVGLLFKFSLLIGFLILCICSCIHIISYMGTVPHHASYFVQVRIEFVPGTIPELFYVSAHIQLHVRISSFARRLQGPQARLKG